MMWQLEPFVVGMFLMGLSLQMLAQCFFATMTLL